MSEQERFVPSGSEKYQLLDEIGHGGMATVYRALDVRLGREVAVKLLHPHLHQNPEASSRFLTEARSVAKLKHSGIVEVFDVSTEDEKERFLVAELIRGPSLRKLMSEWDDIPAEIGACFGVLVGDALAHAHAHGIVHRDVKPENVLVEFDTDAEVAHVKLTDFGIAKVADSQGLTATGQVLGSPAHMAPEQIEGAQVDARTDVFSLGVLVYECMVGHLPFQGNNPAQVLRRVLECVYAEPDKERPTVGQRWSRLIQRAIALQPDDRYGSVEKFVAALGQELARERVVAPEHEIFRYYQDPSAYRRERAELLIGLLVDRAESFRKAGDIQNAAVDLNRAVAFDPGNQELLQKVSVLARGRRRQEMLSNLKRVGVGVGLFVALGGVGFAVARWSVAASKKSKVTITGDSATKLVTPVPSALATTDGGRELPSGDGGKMPVAVKTNGWPRSSKGRRHTHVVSGTDAAASAGMRTVRITASPGSALVSIDGSAPVSVGFGVIRKMDIGEHSFRFSVPNNDTCCVARTYTMRIRAAAGADDSPQLIRGEVGFRDARLTLLGGPKDGSLECPSMRVHLKKGQVARVKMHHLTDVANCIIDGAGLLPREVAVPLRAGGLAPVNGGASR